VPVLREEADPVTFDEFEQREEDPADKIAKVSFMEFRFKRKAEEGPKSSKKDGEKGQHVCEHVKLIGVSWRIERGSTRRSPDAQRVECSQIEIVSSCDAKQMHSFR
jgi:hypothetical protein